MSDQKKFLDYEGVQHLWSKVNMQDYPNNDLLMTIISAIDETKADKNELKQSDWQQEDENSLDYIKNKPDFDGLKSDLDILKIMVGDTSVAEQVANIVDNTLAVSGKAADAKVVGDALTQKSQVQIITWEADD